MTEPVFSRKADARQAVWAALRREKAARFPFPVEGRIPNFAGADRAAARAMEHPALRSARAIKANPDSPQRTLREAVLNAGIVIYLPAPKLRAGFLRLDPELIPPAARREAASLTGSGKWGEPVPLESLPTVDLIVTGSVAVTRQGKRCGKGHGYGDLEYAILRELGHPPVPVLTTVHPLQIVGDFPRDPHDLPVQHIVTPAETINVAEAPAPPTGIDWAALSDEARTEMPVLQELAQRRGIRLDRAP